MTYLIQQLLNHNSVYYYLLLCEYIIPLEAIVQTIPPLERVADDKVVQTNVLPVPPYP